MDGESLTVAYRKVALHEVTESTAESNGCRLFAKIRRKLGPAGWQHMLEAVGLDDLRLAQELAWMLRAMKTEFYQGRAVADCEDNATRARGVELLAEIRGRRKTALELTAPTPLTVQVVRPQPREPETTQESLSAQQESAQHDKSLTGDMPVTGEQQKDAAPSRGLTIRHLDGTELRSDG